VSGTRKRSGPPGEQGSGRLRGACLTGPALALAVSPAAAAQGLFDAERFTLDNGLTVVLVSDHRVPVATHMVWYRVGAADDPPARSGLAHFLEHLMFKGTPRYPDDTLARTVARLGGQLNAFTSHDFTAYFETVPREALETVMALEADRMQNLALDEAGVLTERAVVAEERRQRMDNNPEALLGEQVRAALYLNHPYGRPIIGWAEEIEALGRDDALAFYRRWYAPANAIVVVAGDVTREALEPLAERHYGGLSAAAPGPRQRPAEPDHVAARRVAMRDPRVGRSLLLRRYLAPSAVSGRGELAPALEVLADALGDDAFGVLYRRLVKERAVAADLGVHYRPEAVDRTSFGVSVVPAPGLPLARVEAALDEELETLRVEGLPEKTIDHARESLAAAAIRARDGSLRAGQVLGAALTVGIPLDTLEGWFERVRSVTAREVAEAMAHVMTERRSVTGYLEAEQPGQDRGEVEAANGG